MLAAFDWVGTLNAGVALALILVAGYFAVRGQVERNSNKLRIDRERADLERQRMVDDFARDSLSAQLKELRDESVANQERMRATLHQMADEANQIKLDNKILLVQRDQDAAMYATVVAKLEEANRTIAELKRGHEDTRLEQQRAVTEIKDAIHEAVRPPNGGTPP
jgi:predicted transcriptional regulator